MKNFTPSLFMLVISLLFFTPIKSYSQCDAASAQIDLDASNISARLLTGGGLWWDLSSSQYVAPKGSQTTALFTGSLWMGGLDAGDVLHVAGQTYGAASGNVDYWSGPLEDDGTTSTENCLNWDRFFVVNRDEIEAHRNDWADNGVIDGPVPSSILGWPSSGNPNFMDVNGFELLSTNAGLAPFFDRDENGLYEPMNGDYPLAKGDQSIWWVYNDEGAGGIHGETNGVPVGMEVQVNAFSFEDEPDAEFVTYYDYRLVYKGAEPLTDFYLSLFVDPDLGCWADDFIGCAPAENLGFVYNGDDFDQDCSGLTGYGEEIPMLGIKVIDAYAPGNSTSTGLSKFMFFNNAGQNNPPPGTTDPTFAPEYYNYMSGLWRDGTPLSQGGSGYNPGADPYDFAYDNSEVDGINWNECEALSGPSDRRFLMSFGPYNLNPGDIGTLSFAVVWVPNVVHPCPDITPLVDAANLAEDVYNEHSNEVLSSTHDWAKSGLLTLSPNPASDFIDIKIAQADLEIEYIQLFAVDGSLVEIIQRENSTLETIGLENLNDGIYIYKATLNNGRVATGKFIVKK